jgi:SAM-dependent methyltransferase
VKDKTARNMRDYWDEAARVNAVWYVDTTTDFDAPDMDAFFATGRTVVAQALDDDPFAVPAGRDLAVEIGPGLGRICRALRERFDRVVGIDVSAEMVEKARALVPDDGVEFVVGDGQSLAPIADDSADLVLTFTVFQHIPDAELIAGYVREVGRVLKPGGVFVFQWNSTPGVTAWNLRRAWLGFLQRTHIRPERHRRNAPEFLGSRVPLPQMRGYLDAAGLRLAGTRGDGTLFTFGWAAKE